MTFVLLYFLALLTVSALSTTPSVSVLQSLDEQLPLIARVNQPFSWTFPPSTFNSSDGQSLSYTTSSLPGWLSFDGSNRTFQGTPSINDQGYPEITVTAHDSDSSTSSKFSLCVSHASPPTLNIPISDQFHPNSSSLSSVFFLRPGSAIATQNPSLRIPRKWSFSIGFDSDTFISSEKNLYYELRLDNGTDIPDYMVFNSKTVTLDGVIPPADRIGEPFIVPLALHASDEEGYTAAILPFSVIVADHELSLENSSLPTINITSETEFLVSLLSSADFTGVLVDGDPIQPSNISTLEVDVSGFNWLSYDAPSRTLSGKPGSDVTGTKPTLPAILTTIFDQTLHTQISLALVQSYFSVSDLPSVHVSKGDQVELDLAHWYSTAIANPGHDETDISVSYEPIVAANWLRYDDFASKLNGTVPLDYQSPVDHVTVTFTAYSHTSHSTSHATFTIYIADTGTNNSLSPHPSSLSTDPHRKVVLAITLTFSILGGLSLFIGLFALVRRCARVEDTAVLGEEGRHAWSEKDKRWYGLTLSPHGTKVIERIGNGVFSPNLRLQSRSELPEGLPPPSPLGLGLRRVSERSQQYDEMNPSADFMSPTGAAVMRKKVFLSRIKETVRKVSDKYAARKNMSAVQRPVIGNPILVAPSRGMANVDSMENDQAGPVVVPLSPTNPFDSDEMVLLSRPGSTFMTGSPSASSAEHSIPRRRPDFAPPRNMAQVHFNDGLLVRQVSTGSMGANSFRSGKSGLSGESMGETPMGPPTRPRLVPFTSSTRVPVPQAIGMGAPPAQGVGFVGNRITSQRAKVHKIASKDENGVMEEGSNLKPSGTSEELRMGIHYVRSLGADQLAVHAAGSMAGMGTSPAVSNLRPKSGTDSTDVMRVLVRTGERFKFRVPIPAASVNQGRKYAVRLTSGQALPKFIHPDLNWITSKGVLELSGLATARDLGEMVIGVYGEEDGVCVATVVLEIVGKR
ncbi:hypothetical protein M413DRAFT_67650 [Hebeloma cylindrosporum]|uniref:Dystroglycan-type cadherin-like domain-containing protein n=1 Tax=Hebeloma cylindrosporum TaxID=76867 RepID=A0A0C2YV72_HEBCY|nr:hypothetical protein M413DRAFT_67650 [Hebeloma cylindrosporum h7]